MSPTTFGPYSVIKALGSGGMADVYLARDSQLDRFVAVKAPHADLLNSESRARFVREAKAAAALEHSAIVPIYDYNEANGTPYMVMRYLNGGSLADRISRGPCSPAEVVAVIGRIAGALDYAHNRGIIHRDVKSANILFDDHGDAYMADFGIAWMASAATSELSRLTATGMVRGTFDYISPEQARGDRNLDGRSDLYSLGVVLFEMLSGDVPYQADSAVSLAVQHISAPIPDLRARRPDLPPTIQNVIVRALAKRPEDRYPTGAALVADLQRVFTGQRIATPQPVRGRAPNDTSRDRSRSYFWLAMVALIVLGITAYVLLSDQPPETAATTATIPIIQPTIEISGSPLPTEPEATSTTAIEAASPMPVEDDGISVVETGSTHSELPTSVRPEEIVFYSSLSGDQEIYTVLTDGTERRQLTFSPGVDLYPHVSPDGERIVFVSERDGNPEVYVMNRDGSNQTRLTDHPANDNLPAWSPDGERIIFQSMRNSSGDLFIINADGTGLTQVTRTPEREGHVSWSVDDRLVFNITQGDRYQLFTTTLDGSDRRALTSSQIDEWSPEWSPDGQQILFLSERDGDDGGIYTMDSDGRNVRLVYDSPSEEWGARWSADGTQIAYSVTQPDNTDDLYLMDADGSNVRLVTERGAYPAWAAGAGGTLIPPSPDLFVSLGDMFVPATRVRRPTGLDLATGQLVTIEVIGGGWRAGSELAWPSVDGEGDPQVAGKASLPIPDQSVMTLIGGVGDGAPFVVGNSLTFRIDVPGELWLGPNDDNPADNDGELLIRITSDKPAGGSINGTLGPAAEPMPLSGDGLVRLTFGGRSHYTAAFSPDQSRILMSVEMSDGWQVFEADPNGDGLGRQLTFGPYNHYQADLSPDGRTFLTSVNRDGDGDIYLFDAAGGGMLQQVTNKRGNDYHPRWLPDGEHFIFSVDSDGTADDEVFVGSLDGQHVQLTDNGVFDGFATPSRDGHYIVFYSGRDEDFEIYVMDVDGRNQRRLTTSRGRDASPSFSPDGRWIVFKSDRSDGYELYTMPFTGGETIRLTDSPGDNFFPVISPDGRWLMFQSTRGGEMDIYRQPWTAP